MFKEQYLMSQQNFSKFGKAFQEKVFQSMISDIQWSSQMIEVMSPEYFDLKYLSFLCERYFSYYSKYKTFPTLTILITIIKEDLSRSKDHVLRDQIIEYLHRMKTNPDMGDLQYVKDKSLEFCKRQAFKDALEKSVDLIQTERYESVLNIMKEAISVGMPNSSGHNFFEDIEARFVRINRQVCPTGLDKIDSQDILRGGLGRGELGVIAANTGVGKSHFLVAMGCAAMKAGKNVIHYTFELSEYDTGKRYDSNLCDIPSNEIIERKKEVVDKYDKMELGKLIIKEYPTGSASVMTLRNHIEKLTLKGFKPSLVIVDYADVMKSSKSYDSLRHELKLIYTELRNLAVELQIPIWTASQANKDSSKSDIVGLENLGESYGKAQVADVVLSISRKPMEKSTGSGRIFVAKNRAGRDGLLFPINIDTAKSRFEILDDTEMSLNEAVTQDNNSMKQKLRETWKEVNKKND
jgi:replicative DNA helicase